MKMTVLYYVSVFNSSWFSKGLLQYLKAGDMSMLELTLWFYFTVFNLKVTDAIHP